MNNDPNLEIWAVRLPLKLKPKYLDKMSFPLSQTGSAGAPMARISAGKKQTQYNITVASSSTGAEEMRGMVCLLPRRTKGGKLFLGQYFPYILLESIMGPNPSLAQKPLTGCLLLSESPADPVSSASETRGASLPDPPSNGIPLPSSKRYSHPPHLLKHKYTPTSVRKADVAAAAMAGTDATKSDDPQRGHATPSMEVGGGFVSPPNSPSKSHRKRKKGDEELEGEKDKRGKKRRTQVDS